MMVVHFPMAFLIGSVAFDIAAAFGVAVPVVVPSYLLVAGLATGVLAAVPGAVDSVTTVRPGGGPQANKSVRHAALSMASLGVFALVWLQRRDVAAAPSMTLLAVELLGVALLMIAGLLKDQVGVAEHAVSREPRQGEE
jgi:uncharacterized membrane protein